MIGLGIWQRRVLIGLPFLWLAVFFLLPLGLVAGISLGESADAIPPYRPLLGLTSAGLESHLTLANYRELAESCLRVYANSLGNAALATLLCLLIGYPVALAIARTPGAWRPLLLFLVILPFWTSFLIRVYAWIALLQPSGLVNRLLLAARLDETLLEAAADLGAPPWRVFLGVILPLTVPGIAAGMLLVFIPAVGEFVIPDLLGGPDTLMIGKLLWQEFFDNVDWAAASAIAVALVAVVTLPLLVAQRLAERAA